MASMTRCGASLATSGVQILTCILKHGTPIEYMPTLTRHISTLHDRNLYTSGVQTYMHGRRGYASTPSAVPRRSDGNFAINSAATSPATLQNSPEDDERFMRMALDQAQLASNAGEVPVGAIIVSSSGKILASAHNTTEMSHDPTSHAELQCIRNAAQHVGGWRLLDATLYVTLEPCPMCAGAILQSRVGAVVYGARNILLGADGSWINMLRAGSCSDNSLVQEEDQHFKDKYTNKGSKGVAVEGVPAQRVHPFHPNLIVRWGVLEGECGTLMKEFFRRRRLQSSSQSAKQGE